MEMISSLVILIRCLPPIFALNGSFRIVNVVHIVFVTAFLKNFRDFINFIYLYKKCRHICKQSQVRWQGLDKSGNAFRNS